MASEETDARLRIAVGLVLIAIAATSLIMTWYPTTGAPATWLGISSSLMAVLPLLWGVVLLIGKTRAGRLVLTRRRWKYLMLFGVVLALIIVFMAMRPSLDRSGGNAVLAMFPAITGLFIAQLYEPESSAQFRASDLSDHDAKTWQRISLVLALIAFVIGSIAGIGAAAGNIGPVALLVPIGILFLVFAAAIRVMLRTRNRQLRAKS